MELSVRTYVLSGLGIALVAGLGIVSFRDNPIPVDLATVTRGPLEITINADGHTQVRDLFEVASPISGTALRSPVQVGDLVQAGQTVVAVLQPASSALLDDRSRRQAEAVLQEALASRHVAQADLHQVEEALTFSRSQFERTRALVESGVASLTRLEDGNQQVVLAQAAVEAAQARIEMADGTIERARASLLQPQEIGTASTTCCIDVRAPANGVILSVASLSERPIAVGAPLVSIGDVQHLELVADILSSDAVRLNLGALAYVERWGGDMPLRAQLDRIVPRAYTRVSALGIEEQRVDAYFVLTSESEDRIGLGDGFAVFLRIVEWRAENVVQIPLSATFRVGDDWGVFVLSEGRAHLRTVTLGRRNARVTEVQNGLDPSELVVTHPSDAITDGVSIAQRTEL
ncbi:MAG: TolC family protein [Yoonia sp.]|nr:TolC family protein [Yoonia sp.]